METLIGLKGEPFFVEVYGRGVFFLAVLTVAAIILLFIAPKCSSFSGMELPLMYLVFILQTSANVAV